MQHKPGERLGMLRRGLGLTRGGFADAFGIESSRVSNIEWDRTLLNVEDLQKVCGLIPEVLGFLVLEDWIYVEDLAASSCSKSKVLLSLFQDGSLAGEEFLASKFRSRHGNQEG